ncbi:MAG: hypothetical protein P4M02_07665, partial [Clostridia bacterium]|nr:hypothetical protein [Clostridia bacterium]
ILPVMSDQHVLHKHLQGLGESFDGVDFPGDKFVLDHDVSEKLPGIGISEGTLVAQFVELSDVCQAPLQ